MINQLYLFQWTKTYQAVGILETEQETIIATRNGEIVVKLLMTKHREQVNQLMISSR